MIPIFIKGIAQPGPSSGRPGQELVPSGNAAAVAKHRLARTHLRRMPGFGNVRRHHRYVRLQSIIAAGCSRGRCHRCILDSQGRGLFRCTHHRHHHRRLRGTQHRHHKRSEHRHRRSCRIHRCNRCRRGNPIVNSTSTVNAALAIGAVYICKTNGAVCT